MLQLHASWVDERRPKQGWWLVVGDRSLPGVSTPSDPPEPDPHDELPPPVDFGEDVAEEAPATAPTMSTPRPAANGLGTAAGVLGIVGAVLFWFPGVNLVLAVLALVFGLIGLTRGRREGLATGMAITGIVLGSLGVLVWVLFIVFVGMLGLLDSLG